MILQNKTNTKFNPNLLFRYNTTEFVQRFWFSTFLVENIGWI